MKLMTIEDIEDLQELAWKLKTVPMQEKFLILKKGSALEEYVRKEFPGVKIIEDPRAPLYPGE